MIIHSRKVKKGFENMTKTYLYVEGMESNSYR